MNCEARNNNQPSVRNYAAGAAIRIRCKPCIGFLAAIRQPTSCIMLLHLLFIPYAAGAAILRYQAIRVNGASVMEPVAQ